MYDFPTNLFLIAKWSHLLDSLDQRWLSPQKLRIFANAVQDKGAPLDCVSGLIGGTLKAVVDEIIMRGCFIMVTNDTMD